MKQRPAETGARRAIANGESPVCCALCHLQPLPSVSGPSGIQRAEGEATGLTLPAGTQEPRKAPPESPRCAHRRFAARSRVWPLTWTLSCARR